MANGDIDIPKWLRLIMAFIDRVGFPILAFCMMFYMSYSAIEKTNTTLKEVVSSLSQWQTSTIEFRKNTVDKLNCLQDTIVGNQKNILASVDRVHDKLKGRT